MILGAKTVIETVELIRLGNTIPKPQPEGDLKAAPKISKQDCLLDLNQPIMSIHNFIRGMSPYPTAWIKLQHKENKEEKTLKLFRSTVLNQETNSSTSLRSESKRLILQTSSGALTILEVQLEGKKRLDAISFLAGFAIEEWKII